MGCRSAGLRSILLIAALILAAVHPSGETASGVELVFDSRASRQASYLVSGHITDALTGWPLYARLDIEGGPSEPLWSDPGSGYYSIWLSEGVTYTFQVQAFLPGYLAQSRTVDPLTGNQVEDFALDADLHTCSAPGYTFAAYGEDFETGDGGYTHAGAQDEWEWGAPITWPGGCTSGSLCWGTDLDGDYENGADYHLLSPVIDLLEVPSGTPLVASWRQAWSLEPGSYDRAFAEVSINGGAYQIMWQSTSDMPQSDWDVFTDTLESAAGGTARLRFSLSSDISSTMAGYYIDQVRIQTACTPPSGGLVVGNVYEAEALEGVSGAWVSSDEGLAGLSVGTPDDPERADGFYTLYASSGQHAITATHPSYHPASGTVNVNGGGRRQGICTWEPAATCW